MTDRQSNKLSMFFVVDSFLSSNTAIVNQIPNLNNFVTEFKTIIANIQIQNQRQLSNSTGVAVGKSNARKALISAAGDASRKLAAFAMMVNNDKLLKEVRISDSSLIKSTDEQLIDTCTALHKSATANQKAANPYGITPAFLTSFKNAIDSFKAEIPKTRSSLNEKKEATELLRGLYKNADDLLVKMDMLVDIVRLSQSDFHFGYKSSRMVIDRGGRGLALKINVTDSADNQPIKGVSCKLSGPNNLLIVKRTALKGGLNIKSLSEGSYSLELSKPGYQSIIQEMIIYQNDLTNLNIQMVRQ